MNQKRSNEPVFWLLFGAGGMLAAFLLPIILVVIVVFIPLFHSPNYQQVMMWSSTWIGRLVWFFMISLTSWHALHRISHLTQDFQLGHRKIFQAICYGLAGVITVISATLITLV